MGKSTEFGLVPILASLFLSLAPAGLAAQGSFEGVVTMVATSDDERHEHTVSIKGSMWRTDTNIGGERNAIIRTGDGRFVADAGGGTDSFGHAQLGGVASHLAGRVKDVLGHKVHWTLPDYLQRSARHIASATDLAHALAVGRAAVDCALAGQNAVMPVIVRDAHAPYRWHVDIAPLERIANREKTMPAGFIRRDGYGITAAARRYLQPLVAGEAYPPYGGDGLPDYVVPTLALLRRTLPAWKG